jgi:hypothetical protein
MVAIGLTIPLSTAPRLCPAPGSTARMPPQKPSSSSSAARGISPVGRVATSPARVSDSADGNPVPGHNECTSHTKRNANYSPGLGTVAFQRGYVIRPGGRRGCFGHRVVQQTAAHAMRHAHMAQATTCERPPKGGHLLLSTCTAAFQRSMKGVRAQRPAPHAYPALRHVEHPRGSQLGGSKGRSKINV